MRDMMTSMRFMMLWVMGGAFALLTVLIVAVLLTLLFSSIATVIWAKREMSPTFPEVLLLLVALLSLIGAWMGTIISSLQKALMRQKSGEGYRGWVFVSIIGAIIGVNAAVFVLSLQAAPYINNLQMPPRPILFALATQMVVIPLAMMSFAQMFVLNESVRGAWTWVLANMVAGLVFVTLVLSGITFGVNTTMVGVSAVGLLLTLFAPGIVTGFAMLWLIVNNRRYR